MHSSVSRVPVRYLSTAKLRLSELVMSDPRTLSLTLRLV